VANLTVEKLLDRLGRVAAELHGLGCRVAVAAEGDGWQWCRLLARSGQREKFFTRASSLLTDAALGEEKAERAAARKGRRQRHPPAAPAGEEE
jgi:hypothetical protein